MLGAVDTAAIVDPASGAERRLDLGIEGMTCAAGAARIEKSLNRIPGVTATVSFANESAATRFDPAVANADTLLAAVDRAGYHAFVRRNTERERDEDKARKASAYGDLRRDLVIAVVLTLPLLAQMLP